MADNALLTEKPLVNTESKFLDEETHSAMAYGGNVELTAEEEKELHKAYFKLDIYLTTLVTTLYWLNFLDRANIGNARAAGMQTQLGLDNYQYSICLTLTYVAFLLAEWPSVMIAKKFGFHRILPLLCVGWGLCCTFQVRRGEHEQAV